MTEGFCCSPTTTSGLAYCAGDNHNRFSKLSRKESSLTRKKVLKQQANYTKLSRCMPFVKGAIRKCKAPRRIMARMNIGQGEGTVFSYERRSQILKAIAHPARMEIIVRLKEDGCNVSEIQKNLGLPQSTISQHLRVLKNAGILSSRRNGTKVCYALEMKKVRRIVKMLGRP